MIASTSWMVGKGQTDVLLRSPRKTFFFLGSSLLYMFSLHQTKKGEKEKIEEGGARRTFG